MIRMNSSLSAWIKKNQVSLFLFDLDDTLIDTNAVFTTQLTQCQKLIIDSNPTLSPPTVLESVFSLCTESYKKMFGNFDRRWPYMVQQLVHRFQIQDTSLADRLLATLQVIQYELPQLKPLVKETLEELRVLGMKTGVVTQAEEAWTAFKLQGLELTPFFDAVFPIGSEHPKTSQEWEKAMIHFETPPQSTVVVGDSLSNDMVSAKQAGVKHLFWVKDEKGWAHSLEGDMPPGIVEITGVADLLQLL